MVFIQKFDFGITVIFEKINGNTVIQNLVRPPPMNSFDVACLRLRERSLWEQDQEQRNVVKFSVEFEKFWKLKSFWIWRGMD